MMRLFSVILFFGAASSPPQATATYCGCRLCTQTVWDTIATDAGGSYSCGARISWLQTQGSSEAAACQKVASEFPAVCLCNSMSCSAGPPTPTRKFLNDPDPSKLIWSDEFDVDGPPDPSKWGYDLGDGCPNLCQWGNQEEAYYTKLPGNVNITNGILRINAKKESGYSLPFTSARIVTRGLRSFKYGRVQFRASLAKCKAKGTWPALWMVSFFPHPFSLV